MKKLIAITLALGTVATGTTLAASTRGGKMVYGRYADSLFLDPVLNDANVDIWVLGNLYDTLLRPTANGKGVTPGLATGTTLSNGGKTMTIKLRPNIKFADGSAITPADVKFSLDRARNPKNGAWGFTLESIASVSTPNATSVVLNLSRPDPSLPAALATFNAAIMSQKLFNAAPGADDAAKAKAFAEKPIGSGPFILTEWKKSQFMTLKRNPYYWEKGEDGKALPYLDELRFEIVPDDNTRILKLQSRELDGAEYIPFARVTELKANPNINMSLFPSTLVNYVVLNNRPTLKSGAANPLSSVKVRQALNYATDKNALIQVVSYGNGTVMKSYMSSSTPLFDARQKGYPFDLERARKLLAEAGFAGGFEITTMALAGSADDTALASALQQMWAPLGVRLKIGQVDNATRTARYRANDFQMRISKWTNDIADPNQITSYFAIYKTVESLHTGFQNASLEKLFDQSQEETNRTKRTALYRQIQSIYMNAAPILFLYEAPYTVALQKYVKGFVQIPLGNNIFVRASLEK